MFSGPLARVAAFNLFVRDKLEEFKAKGVKAPEPREGEKQARNPLFRCALVITLHLLSLLVLLGERARSRRAARCSGAKNLLHIWVRLVVRCWATAEAHARHWQATAGRHCCCFVLANCQSRPPVPTC